MAALENEILLITESIGRFKKEYVTVEVYSEIPKALQKQFFVTIADTAVSITKSEVISLSDTKLSKVVRDTIQNNSFLNKVVNTDTRKNKRKNEIFTLDDVTNIASILLFGMNSYKKNIKLPSFDKNLDLNSSLSVVNSFFNLISSVSADAAYISSLDKDDNESIEEYVSANKNNSLLLKTPMLRSLAEAYRSNVIFVQSLGPTRVYTKSIPNEDVFKAKMGGLDFKINSNSTSNPLNSFWYLTTHAVEGKSQVLSTNQDMSGLAKKLTILLSPSSERVILSDGKFATISNGLLTISKGH